VTYHVLEALHVWRHGLSGQAGRAQGELLPHGRVQQAGGRRRGQEVLDLLPGALGPLDASGTLPPSMFLRAMFLLQELS
jgi:hypothetical protein